MRILMIVVAAVMISGLLAVEEPLDISFEIYSDTTISAIIPVGQDSIPITMKITVPDRMKTDRELLEHAQEQFDRTIGSAGLFANGYNFMITAATFIFIIVTSIIGIMGFKSYKDVKKTTDELLKSKTDHDKLISELKGRKESRSTQNLLKKYRDDFDNLTLVIDVANNEIASLSEVDAIKLDDFLRITDILRVWDDQFTEQDYSIRWKAYIYLKQFRFALREALEGIERGKNGEKWYERLSQTYTILKQYTQALDAIDKVLEINPNNINAWYAKGLILREDEQVKEALLVMKHVTYLSPQMYQAWVSISNYYSRLREFDKAEEAGRQALDIRPDDAKAHSNLGFSLLNQQKYEEAQVEYDRAISFDSNLKDALQGKGTALANLGNYDEALEVFRYLLEQDSSISINWSNLAYIYFKQDDIETSKHMLEIALNLDSKNFTAWYNLARLYSKKKQKIPMLNSLRWAIELNKDYKSAARKTEDFKAYSKDSDFIALTKE